MFFEISPKMDDEIKSKFLENRIYVFCEQFIIVSGLLICVDKLWVSFLFKI